MHFKAGYTMNLSIMAITAFVVITAVEWPWQAALFPVVIAVPVFFLALGDLLWNVAGAGKHEKKPVMDFTFSEAGDKALAARRTFLTVAWILAFFLMIILLGFPSSVPLFIFSYLKFQARENWKTAVGITVVVWGIFWGLFVWLLHTQFPPGWLQGLVRLT